MNTKIIGNEAETKVCDFLTENGYIVLERNYRSKVGEIDIIASKENVICFVEVKKVPIYWDETEIQFKVDFVKQNKIKQTASQYLVENSATKYDEIRFDVAVVRNDEIKYYQGAF